MRHPIDNQYRYGIVYNLDGQIVGFNLSPDVCICLTDDEIERVLGAYAKRKQEQNTCNDCISRQAVLDMIENAQIITDGEFCGYCTEDIDINILPPVTPQPKTGHWIEKDGFDGDTYYDCSECGESWTTIEGIPYYSSLWDNDFKYCPNCGVKMIESQESESENDD